jgi:hypothetical protein
MEPWQIVFITLYGGVLAYLLLSQVQQGKIISSMSTMLEQVSKKQDKLDEKLNLFLKTEVDTLKDLVGKIGTRG